MAGTPHFLNGTVAQSMLNLPRAQTVVRVDNSRHRHQRLCPVAEAALLKREAQFENQLRRINSSLVSEYVNANSSSRRKGQDCGKRTAQPSVGTCSMPRLSCRAGHPIQYPLCCEHHTWPVQAQLVQEQQPQTHSAACRVCHSLETPIRECADGSDLVDEWHQEQQRYVGCRVCHPIEHPMFFELHADEWRQGHAHAPCRTCIQKENPLLAPIAPETGDTTQNGAGTSRALETYEDLKDARSEWEQQFFGKTTVIV